MFMVTLQQVIKLFIMLLIGYAMHKAKLLPENAPKVLSTVLVWVSIPALNILNFSSLTMENLSSYVQLLVVSTAFMIVLFSLGTVVGKHMTKDSYNGKICTYSINIPNTGFFGTPLILSMMGAEALLPYSVMGLPANIYIYTVGYCNLMGYEKIQPKRLLNPVLLSMLAGIVLAFMPFSIPPVVNEILVDARACIGPLSMLLTGCTIAQFDPKNILGSRLIYPVVALRMIVVPLLVLGAGRLLNVSQTTLLYLMLFFSMPTGLNTVVYPSSIGKDCRLGAGMACISNVLALITIPIMLSLAA